jgi:hypothetical protein
VRTSEGKKPVGRPRRRWEDSITMDLMGSCAVDASFSGQGPVMTAFEHRNELLG